MPRSPEPPEDAVVFSRQRPCYPTQLDKQRQPRFLTPAEGAFRDAKLRQGVPLADVAKMLGRHPDGLREMAVVDQSAEQRNMLEHFRQEARDRLARREARRRESDEERKMTTWKAPDARR